MRQSNKLFRLVLMGVFIALCYVAFMFLKLPIPGTNASVHFGNALCLLAVLIFAQLDGGFNGSFRGCITGGLTGGLCGALGMGIADLTGPGYLPYFPSTLVLKLGFAMICALVLGALVKAKVKRLLRCFIGCAAAMLFNLIAAPLANYLTNTFLIGAPSDAAAIVAAWSSLPSAINAVVSTIAAPLLFTALLPAIRRMSR